MTSKKFEEALKILDVVEGGYVNDPNDPGKATKYGITQRTYNNYRMMQKLPSKDVKNLTRDEAKEIYYKEYWLKSGAEDYKDPKFSLAVFDGEVNHGPNVNKKLKNKSGNNLKKYLDNFTKLPLLKTEDVYFNPF